MKVNVKIEEAVGLDENLAHSVYCVANIEARNTKRKTKTQLGCDPVFNQDFSFQNIDSDSVLIIQLYDEVPNGTDEKIGTSRIPFGSLQLENKIDDWFDILEVNGKNEAKSHNTGGLCQKVPAGKGSAAYRGRGHA